MIDGGPAFPRPFSEDKFNEDAFASQHGMTLRDYFAGQALAGVMANPATNTINAAANGMSGQQLVEAAVFGCYVVADIMLRARQKGGGET